VKVGRYDIYNKLEHHQLLLYTAAPFTLHVDIPDDNNNLARFSLSPTYSAAGYNI